MDEVTMIWECPDCERQDDVTLECVYVEGTSHPDDAYGTGRFMWSTRHRYVVKFRCAPCEDAAAERAG